MQPNERYVPALSFKILTPIYDPIVNLAMRNGFYMTRLIQQARIQPGMRLLDVGCGTATLTMMVKQAVPQVEVTGLDGDPQILQIASGKASKAGLDVKFDLGMAYALPYPGNSFDRVFSSMMVHHLSSGNKTAMMKEVQRVLRQAGEFHLVDFGTPTSAYSRLVGMALEKLENVEDNIKGRMLSLIQAGGFSQVEETGHSETWFGTLRYYRAVK